MLSQLQLRGGAAGLAAGERGHMKSSLADAVTGRWKAAPGEGDPICRGGSVASTPGSGRWRARSREPSCSRRAGRARSTPEAIRAETGDACRDSRRRGTCCRRVFHEDLAPDHLRSRDEERRVRRVVQNARDARCPGSRCGGGRISGQEGEPRSEFHRKLPTLLLVLRRRHLYGCRMEAPLALRDTGGAAKPRFPCERMMVGSNPPRSTVSKGLSASGLVPKR